MNTFDELDRHLNEDYNINLWSDDAIDFATELVNRLDEAEWNCLDNVWKDRSIDWQVRLAEAVFSSEKQQVIPLLINMLKAPAIQVALAAAGSLEAKDDVWTPDASLRKDLERLRDSTEGGYRYMIEGLIAHIPN